MSILKVARMGHPVLRARARAIDIGEIKSSRIQQLIDDMFETMKEYQGVGLAAPQVHASILLFVAGFAPDPDGEEAEERVPLMTVINPEITVASPEMVEDWEGCLSVPDLRGKVPRFTRVRVEAYGHDGKQLRFDAAGFHARVVQHECDHLDGKVYLDRMRSMESLSFLPEFRRYWLPQAD